MKVLFVFMLALSSCTHWLIDTDTRIQVRNRTQNSIYNFSVVSKDGKVKVLVPGEIKKDSSSRVYDCEWIGEFNFAIFTGEDFTRMELGTHKLKGGSVRVEIKEDELGAFSVEWK